MATERDIAKLSTIFDIKIGKALCLEDSISSRGMLTYDKKENRKEFKLLNRKLTKEMNRKITLWLEKNMEINDIVTHLNAHEIDIDRISH